LFKDFLVADCTISLNLLVQITPVNDGTVCVTNLSISSTGDARSLILCLFVRIPERLLREYPKGQSYEQEIPAEYLDKINKELFGLHQVINRIECSDY
jgi:hypothetical protein